MSKNALSGFAATPADLRQIVLSYLCDNCYAATAQIFARDSATGELDRDGDEILMGGETDVLDVQVLRRVQSRKEIKVRILSGQINEAIDMLKLHFPTVLASSGPHADSSRYNPAHLFLNLRIQNFIEQSRTVPLPWSPDFSVSSNPSTQHSSPVTELSSLPTAEEEERKNRLLNLMHELYMLTHALVLPMDRATYLTELSTVGGLLAYAVPEKSREMRRYLDITRREAVAEQINEALLYRCNVSLPGAAELSARHTTLVFATLSSLGRKLPSPELCPAGLEVLLCGNTSRSHDTKDLKAAKDRNVQSIFPTFDLRDFLGPEPA